MDRKGGRYMKNRPEEPRMLRRRSGGWLAVSPLGTWPKIGTQGTTVQKARSAYELSARRWEQLLAAEGEDDLSGEV
jgi:hypothetical protein